MTTEEIQAGNKAIAESKKSIELCNRYDLPLKEFYYEIHKLVKYHGWVIKNQRRVQIELRRRYYKGETISSCISYILLNR